MSNSITIGDKSTAISNAVSVGSTGNERQIKNVKDATEDQDAATYKQLKEYIRLDGTNIDNTVKTTLINKLSAGANIDTPTGALVTDTLIKTKLDMKANSSDLAGYVKLDGSNINTDPLRKGLASKLSENSSLETPKDILVTDKKVKDYLTDNYTTTTELNNLLGNKLSANDLTNNLISSKLTKGNVTSTTLDVTNGTGRLLGADELKLEIKNKSITKDKLADT